MPPPRQPRRSPVAAALTLLLTAALAGCSLPGGGQVTLFPEPHRLLPIADELRRNIPGPVPRELEERVLPPYTVEPGDVLLVQPGDLESPVRLPADQSVMPDGTISLGEYGRIVVAGMNLDQIEGAARNTILARGKDPGPVVARVITRISKVFYVLGEVNSPGAYPLDGRESVLDGIMVAGGLTDRAAPGRIILARPAGPGHPRLVWPVCYRQIVQLGDTTTNYQLAPGDRIYVPSRTFWEGLCTPRADPAEPCSAGTTKGGHCGSWSSHGPAHPVPVH